MAGAKKNWPQQMHLKEGNNQLRIVADTLGDSEKKGGPRLGVILEYGRLLERQ